MLKYFKIIASIIILSYFVSCSNKDQDSLLLDAEGGNMEISSTSTEEIEIEDVTATPIQIDEVALTVEE